MSQVGMCNARESVNVVRFPDRIIDINHLTVATADTCSNPVSRMQVLCSLLIALAYFSHGSTSETVEVAAGEPFILNFDYDGPKVGVQDDLTKDGEKVDVDKIRTFYQLGTLYFTEMNELDSGNYRLAVNAGNGAEFERTIFISG